MSRHSSKLFVQQEDLEKGLSVVMAELSEADNDYLSASNYYLQAAKEAKSLEHTHMYYEKSKKMRELHYLYFQLGVV